MGDVHFDMPIREALDRLNADPELANVFPFTLTKLKVEVQAIQNSPDMFLVTLLPQDGRPGAQSPLPGFLVVQILAQLTRIEDAKVQAAIKEEAANLSEELKELLA